MGQLNGGTINYNSNGKFIVERYISSKRAWRFLSIATNDPLQSIKNQWQEGAAAIGIDPKPGSVHKSPAILQPGLRRDLTTIHRMAPP